jgi:hypothetical protein
MKTGWQRINVYDDRGDKDDDYDYWFNFKSNGKRRSDTNKKKISGKYYAFDEAGVMIYEWYQTGDNVTLSDKTTTVSSATLAENWNYFSSPEDGARVVKGWFKVVPPEDDTTFLENDDTFATSDSDDESERWYYADSDGLVAGKIKKIKGKYYGFWPEDGKKAGRMLTGLCALEMNGEEIVSVVKADMDADELDDFMDSKLYTLKNIRAKDEEGNRDTVYAEKSDKETGVYLYYFGADSQKDTDGAMKTGATTISLDGESYSFYFSKTGGAESKGRGVNGLDGKDYVYMHGQKVKASSDDKYKLVYASGDYGKSDSVAWDCSSADVREYAKSIGTNKDNETVMAVLADKFSSNYYLVNTSGKIQKTAAAKKDGDDWYWYVDDYNIKMYTNNKTLTKTTSDGTINAIFANKSGWSTLKNRDAKLSDKTTDYYSVEKNALKYGEYDSTDETSEDAGKADLFGLDD